MTRSREPFSLEKWYVDCTDDVRTAIVYWTAVRWRGLSITWHSVDVYAPAATTLHHHSLARVAAPARSGVDGWIRWNSDAIRCSAECEPLQSPFYARLHSDDGAVDWHCEAAAAHARIDVNGSRPVIGLGYAERLRLTVPPWHLKIDDLRWGRWVAADGTHNMVWIDWRGLHPLTMAFADGMPRHAPVVSDSDVAAGELSLSLEDRQTLVARELGEIINPIRPLAAVVPQSLLRAGEVKWRSRGIAAGFVGGTCEGWAIHEVVRFP